MNPLRGIRQARGLSQLQVAAAAGTSIKTIQRIEAGRVDAMQLGTVVRVAHALELAPAELVPVLRQRPRARL